MQLNRVDEKHLHYVYFLTKNLVDMISSQERVDFRFPILAKTSLRDFQTCLSIVYLWSFLKNTDSRVLMNISGGEAYRICSHPSLWFLVPPLLLFLTRNAGFPQPKNRSRAKLFQVK